MKKHLSTRFLPTALLLLFLIACYYNGFSGLYGPTRYYSFRSKPLSEGEQKTLHVIYIIGLVLIAFVFFGFGIIVKRQVGRTRKKIQEAAKFDAMWNEEKMIAYARETYLKIQEAWTQRELKQVNELVTPHFIARFQPLLNVYRQKRIVNLFENIVLDKISIVKIQDSANDAEDSFKAYIKGSKNDYFAYDSDFTAPLGNSSETVEFEELYVFVRDGNMWKLDNIINDPEKKDFR
ncbi:MAG TPA: TIM44-like domain-containing protein [Flavobacteriales bacterium]|nr:TIM44-like domain-containing protein [Flavobacteriales bacterium]